MVLFTLKYVCFIWKLYTKICILAKNIIMIRENIKKEMDSLKMSQSELSDKSGVSKNQLSAFFRGKSLNIDNVNKICSALNLQLIKIY